MNQEDIAMTLISMEKTALKKLNRGNPSGYLEIYADEITYFDPFQEKRFDGLESVKTFYESMQGPINIERYEMIEPVVQIAGEAAVLNYNFHISETIAFARDVQKFTVNNPTGSGRSSIVIGH